MELIPEGPPAVELRIPQVGPPTNAVGYSCQVRLALYLNANYYGDRHYMWFSTELNPVMNGDSANPLWLYLAVDRAVKLGDVNHPKIRDLKEKLQRGVDKMRRGGVINDETAAKLKADIASAELKIDWLRPQLCKINVASISGRITREEPYSLVNTALKTPGETSFSLLWSDKWDTIYTMIS